MEEKHIDYPVSANYRPDWGEWEAVREVMQNAMDSDAEVSMDFTDQTLRIVDEGGGFELKHLLIGETTKGDNQDNMIGKFGEGLKFALLTLKRKGYEVTVRSNDIVLQPEMVDIFDIPCLRINYSMLNEAIQGTEVVVKGFTDSFRERFLSLEKKQNFQPQILLDPEFHEKLFIKGIYVKEMPSVAGYNLIIDRENPLGGDVDSAQVQDALTHIILDTDNLDYMIRLLAAVKAEPDGLFKEFYAPFYTWQKLSHPDLWQEAVLRVFGEKVCKFTSTPFATEASYRGYTVVESTAGFLSHLLKTDIEVLAGEDTGEDEYECSKENLSDQEQKNLARCIEIFNRFWTLDSKKVRVIVFDDKTILGRTKTGEYIKVSKEVCSAMKRLLSVMIHEFVHFRWGYLDCTPPFQDSLGEVASTIIAALLARLPEKDGI